MNTTLLKKCRYWPFYCEENVWRLCNRIENRALDAWAIIVTGKAGPVAYLKQRFAHVEEPLILWDYHVFLLFREANSAWQVLDRDSQLQQPCSATTYFGASFPDRKFVAPATRPIFRRIEAKMYQKTLSTDRRHMRDAHGEYRNTPPPWPPIGQGHNLNRMIDMEDAFVGEILELPELESKLASDPS